MGIVSLIKNGETIVAHTEPALTVGDRLDRLSIGAFHWRMFALIGGGLFVDVYDQSLAGAVLATLVKSGESNLTLNGWFL
jgi:putative MFS transporter